MTVPLDDDAPAIADVAARAVAVLTDATAPQVGYPGLQDTHDVEHVLAALAGLTDDLPEAVRQIDRFLDQQLAQGKVAAASGSTQDAAATVRTAQDALRHVQTAAERLALLLTRAEAAVLALTPTSSDPDGGPST